jgi:hypothetical protein
MLLDRIDIDAHGPLQRVELGPFSEQINVVNAPEGSGKTALARFLRDALVERRYPLGMLSSSTGRVVFAGLNGLVHYYREQDGTAHGRQTVQYEPRGSETINFDVDDTCWLQNISESSDADRAIESFKIPEAIADCIITDSAVTNVSRVVSACVRSGLDSHDFCELENGEIGDPNSGTSPNLNESISDRFGTGSAFEDHLPSYVGVSPQTTNSSIGAQAFTAANTHNQHQAHTAKQIRAELADIEAELASLHSVAGPLDDTEHSSLLSRRSWLTQCLNDESKVAAYGSFVEPKATGVRPNNNTSSFADDSVSQPGVTRESVSERKRQLHLQARLRELHDRARTLRSKQNQLRNRLSDLSKQPLSAHASDQSTKPTTTDRAKKQRQVEEIDAQVIHWHRAQMEVAALQHCLLTGKNESTSTPSPVDERSLRRMRLNRFLHALDKPKPSDRERMATASSPLARGRESINHHILLATRQIDWLIDRYAGPDRVSRAWYEQDQSVPGTSTTLSSKLRTIRDVLRQIHAYNQGYSATNSRPPTHELSLARRCEQWLLSAIKQLKRHRDEVLRRTHAFGDAADREWSVSGHQQMETWNRERKDRLAELESVTLSLDICLSEAAAVRRSTQSSTMNSRGTVNSRGTSKTKTNWHNEDKESARSNRELLIKELKEVDSRIGSLSRAQWLRTRRTQMLNQLGFPHQKISSSSPLAHEASRWLIRLTGGRLQRIEWSTDTFTTNSKSNHSTAENNTVEIDGRNATECPDFDRACAVLSVRMAAGDVLARSGRHVPLVIETIGEVEQKLHGKGVSQADAGTPKTRHPANDAFTAALQDYASDGRQLLILTSSSNLTEQLGRVGSRIERIHSERIVHPHRPLWKSNYANERYVGPHPHTYGLQDVSHQTNSMKGSNYMPNVNANQRFDMAWQDPQGRSVNTTNLSGDSIPSESTDWASDGSVYRDGYYYTDTYSTVDSPRSANDDLGNHSVVNEQRSPTAKEDLRMSNNRNVSTAAPTSPFFLSVDSPIDQAPSIDAVAAARLRGLQVSHVVHLMQQDPCRLADALGLANVEANTIRRWQAECRLVCRVPNLRGFDARILVACGITTPAALAATPPVSLLHKVETFLATERGQQLLLSGSSHELARITGWIATANSQGLSKQADKSTNAHGQRSQSVSKRSNDSESRRDASRPSTSFAPTLKRSRRGEHNHRQKRKQAQTTHKTDINRTSVVQFEQNTTVNGQSPTTASEGESEIRELRFYLQQDAPVVDAPSIGERMEERLQAIGIYTIQNLLDADAEQIAEQLDHRRVDADTVLQWQQQTTLVCCIPMLRGHDAQLLVAADIITPADLAGWDAEELFQVIDPIARSKEGKRILRGGNLPDIEEVTDWINFAQYNRELRAA